LNKKIPLNQWTDAEILYENSVTYSFYWATIRPKDGFSHIGISVPTSQLVLQSSFKLNNFPKNVNIKFRLWKNTLAI